MDIKTILTQGRVTKEIESAKGKIKYTVRNQTVGDRLTELGTSPHLAGQTRVAMALSKFNGKEFKTLDESFKFVATMHATVLGIVSTGINGLENEIDTLIADWAKEVTVPELDSDEVLDSVISGNRVTISVRDEKTGITVVLQSLTAQEEAELQSGRKLGELDEKGFTEFVCDLLRYGVKSINGKGFKDSEDSFLGIRSFPPAFMFSMFRWHKMINDKIKEVLSNTENF